MTRVTASLSVYLDGVSSGPHQSEELPFGEGIDDLLHRWMFEAGEEHAAEIAANLAADAYVMGRNMFGPVRGDWATPTGGAGGVRSRPTTPRCSCSPTTLETR
ncbi:MAG TPA: hypothetical protein VFU98_09350 [Microlunatus sp.]|nr:hypothetical protein [Microlunatus sp.]